MRNPLLVLFPPFAAFVAAVLHIRLDTVLCRGPYTIVPCNGMPGGLHDAAHDALPEPAAGSVGLGDWKVQMEAAKRRKAKAEGG